MSNHGDNLNLLDILSMNHFKFIFLRSDNLVLKHNFVHLQKHGIILTQARVQRNLCRFCCLSSTRFPRGPFLISF